jgi:hypothetical protein
MTTAETYQRPRFEMLPTGGWVIEILDHSTKPPKVVKDSRRFVDTGQIAGLFMDSFATNTGILERSIGLSGVALSAAKGVYLYIEPSRVRPIVHYDGGHKKPYLMWVPPSAWIISAPVAKSNTWSAKVALIVPDERGMFGPKSQIGQYPMSNTYENYNICWGNVGMPQLKLPQQCRRVIESFFASDFNGHIWCLNVPFLEYIKRFSSKEFLALDEAAKWKELKGYLGDRFLRSTLSNFWSLNTKTQELDTDDDEAADDDPNNDIPDIETEDNTEAEHPF